MAPGGAREGIVARADDAGDTADAGNGGDGGVGSGDLWQWCVCGIAGTGSTWWVAAGISRDTAAG